LKLLVVIGLVALLVVFLYRRLRPYLNLIRGFLKSIRHFQQMSGSGVGRENQSRQSEKLVRCEACGTWIPVGRALTVDLSGPIFCSADCLSGRGAQKPRPTGVRS
jgi:hypothetical protein